MAAWEDALRNFGPSGAKITTREDVVAGSSSDSDASSGTKAGPWIANYKVTTSNNPDTNFDIWWSANLSDGQSTVVGANLDWGQFGDKSPLALFTHQADDILGHLISAPNENDNTSVWSFDAAGQALHDFDGWLSAWLPKVKAWADDVDAPASDFQGSAAGAFRSLLLGFGEELNELHTQLNQSTPRPWESLHDSRVQLGSTHVAMWNAYSDWRANPRSMPVNCLHDAFLEAMSQATVTISPNDPTGSDGGYDPGYTVSINVPPPWGPPDQQAFWTEVETRAKSYWTDMTNRLLDPRTQDAVSKLGTQYTHTSGAVHGITATTLTPPTSSDPTNNDSDSTNPFDGLANGFNNLFNGLNHPNGGGGNAPAPNFGASNDFNGSGGQDPSKTGMPSIGSTSAGGDPNQVPLLGKDGKPIVDPSTGLPMMVPAGTTVGANGALKDANGNPIMKNGKPETVPEGTTVGTSDGLNLPKGSTINPDGTVTGPDGKLLNDAYGNKMVLPKGAKIGANGEVVDAQGNPLSQSGQLERDLFPSQPTPTTRTTSAVPDEFGAELGGVPRGTGASTMGGDQVLGTTSGMSEKAIANGGVLTPEEAAAQQSAAEAAEEAQMMGRQAASSGEGMPMMPPPMGGMGGAGGPNGQDRQRTTWLAEEEEVWGTETTAVSGVIGR